MAEEEVDAAFLLICEITLSFFFPFFPFVLSLSSSFSLAIYLFSRFLPFPPRDLSPCQSLLFLGLLFIGMQEYLFPLSLSTSFATRLQPEPTDFLFHCFCPCSHAPIYRNNYCSGCLFILRQCNSCWILIVCVLRVNLPHAHDFYDMYV